MSPIVRKGYGKKRARALAMTTARKRRALPPTESTPVSPENDNQSNRTNALSREVASLHASARVYPSINNDSGNRLIHWDSLRSIVSSNVVCRHCGSDMLLSETTVGIATQVKLTCQNKECNLCEKNKVKKTDEKKFRKNSSESFALNCQFVLALMQTGCGGSEADVLLTFLDLPHSSTFHKFTFARVQEAMRPTVKELSEKCKKEAIESEVLSTVGNEKFKEWKEKK